ncbi:hypothetical protein RFI_34358 [Reticulomyxa filosa]|uniref:Uncharacterized protein n=1 Tax=Reticulomyxa filosa TaxID=46433 RepID=X6LM89_RETFI|nr:hypothetical protein RFI_34358 [Reticulomyxa filosa]|eukprot:ETO03053.1 hypothetical protein RFI_34358 [Reticulomyxa filosa]
MSIIDHPKNDLPFGTIDDVRGSGHMPLIQTSAQIQKENYITVYMNPSPATTCMSNGTLSWFDLQPRIAQNVKTFDLRLNITCSNAKYEDHGMIKFYEYKEHYRFVYPNPLEVNETRDVYIPIPTSYWDIGAIHFQHMSQDIRIEFEFDSDFVISGTATNITVNNIAAVINQFDLTGDEQEMWLRDFQSTTHYYNYLDCIRVTDNSKTMTQSAKTNFDVQNFIAKSPFLLTIGLGGDGATVEMENPSNEPLLGKGNAPKWEYLEKRFVELTGKKPIRGFYIINFTQSIYDSYNGVIKGFYPFAGVKDTLAITFGGASIQETSTLTPDAAPTAGRFHVMFDGQELGTVAYNANAATLAAAINGSSISLGQSTRANSLPVTMASDQTNMPVNIAQMNGTYRHNCYDFALASADDIIHINSIQPLLIGFSLCNIQITGITTLGLSPTFFLRELGRLIQREMPNGTDKQPENAERQQYIQFELEISAENNQGSGTMGDDICFFTF